MIKRIVKSFWIAPFLVLIIAMASCSNDADDSQPGVTEVSPSSGSTDDYITITGKGFSKKLEENIITFNHTVAEVTSATSTKITMRVPSKAGDGDVVLFISGHEIGRRPFDYIESAVTYNFAGDPTRGAGDEDGEGSEARFSRPNSVVIDAAGNLYVSDEGNHRIRKITPSGIVSTLAGTTLGFEDGDGEFAKFYGPSGLAIDADGNLYVSDYGNHRIRKVSPTGLVSTFAGSTQGFEDGANPKFDFTGGIAIDASGNVYVSDLNNYRIRKITPGGVASTLAGGAVGTADGVGSLAKFFQPMGLATDANGNIYVADTFNHRIRKVTPSGEVSTIAGSVEGFLDGTGTGAKFYNPYGLEVDAAGNVYVADTYNHKIRKITPSGVVTTLRESSFIDLLLENPAGIAIDADGTLYIADAGNSCIRKIVFE